MAVGMGINKEAELMTASNDLPATACLSNPHLAQVQYKAWRMGRVIGGWGRGG